MSEQAPKIRLVRSFFGSAWAPVIAGLAILYGYYTTLPGLSSLRPPPSKDVLTFEMPASPGLSSYPSRLWEDPFTGLPTSVEQSEVAKIVDEFPKTFSHVRKATARGDEIMLLMVFVPGGKAAEEVEQRMRSRFAVNSALTSLGYELSFANRMSYGVACIRPSMGPAGDARDSIHVFVPMKLYIPANEILENEWRAKGIKKVIVCWINEDQLGQRPLYGLGQIAGELFGNLSKPQDKEHGNVQVRIVGPTGSGGLLAMYDELSKEKNATAEQIKSDDAKPVDPKPFYASRDASEQKSTEKDESLWANAWRTAAKNVGTDVKIYSPRATASVAKLRNTTPAEFHSVFSNRRVVEASARSEKSTSCKIDLVRTVGTDAQLVAKLRSELELRRAWPTIEDKGRYVVLVVPADTPYGRNFPDVVREEVRRSIDQQHQWRKLVVPFFYFRGIDGQSARTAEPERDSRSNDGSDENQGPRELPDGTSQRDYLRRLAANITSLHDELRRSGKGRVASVGLVGVDVYDKLLILRALRPQFPEMVFFTTDLNAGFNAEAELPYTRNLIVASHFGLSLNRDLGYNAPPFRDSYQTATFLSTVLALRDRRFYKEGLNDDFRSDPWGVSDESYKERRRLETLLFEIGYDGPYQLTRSAEMSVAAAYVQPAGSYELAKNTTGRASFYIVVFVVCCVLCSGVVFPKVGDSIYKIVQVNLVTLYQIWRVLTGAKAGEIHEKGPAPADGKTRGESDGTAGERLHETIGIWALVVVLLVFIAFNVRDSMSPSGEPATIISGINVWPSIYLLWASTIISAVTVFSAARWEPKYLSKQIDTYLGDKLNEKGPDLKAWREAVRRRNSFFRFNLYLIVLLLLVNALLFVLFKHWQLPVRGIWAERLCRIGLVASELSLIAAAAYFWGILDRCCKRINNLGDTSLEIEVDDAKRFGDETLRRAASIAKRAFGGWLGVRFIADDTGRVGQRVFWVIVAAVLLILARLHWWDNWYYSIRFMIMQAIIYAILLSGVLRLRREANKARQRILEGLENEYVAAISPARKSTANSQKVAVIDHVADRIRDIDKGAYQPLVVDPLFWVIAAPSTGGLAALIDAYSRF